MPAVTAKDQPEAGPDHESQKRTKSEPGAFLSVNEPQPLLTTQLSGNQSSSADVDTRKSWVFFDFWKPLPAHYPASQLRESWWGHDLKGGSLHPASHQIDPNSTEALVPIVTADINQSVGSTDPLGTILVRKEYDVALAQLESTAIRYPMIGTVITGLLGIGELI